MKTILHLHLLLLVLPFVFAADTPCPGVPSMPAEAACRKACGTKLMYDLCMETLRDIEPADPSSSHEATQYALHAANHALDAYIATADALGDQLRRNASLPGDEREAYEACGQAYTYAEQSMSRVVVDMRRCSFGGLAGEYTNGLAIIDGCRDRVMRLAPPSPLNGELLVDRNKAVLAYFLGKLLGI